MNKKSSFDINFSVLFDNLARRLWLIILTAVVAAGLAYGYVSFLVRPMYSSTATIYIGNNTDAPNYSDLNVSETLAKDFEVIIKKRTVLDEVISSLGLNMDVSALRSCISVNNISNTRILDITASTEDPALSKKIVDKVCDISSERIVDIVNVNYVKIMDTGSLPSSPSNINLIQSMALAGIAGALICIFIITVKTLMDDRIKSPEDIEYYLGISVLATTPFTKTLESESTKSGLSFKKK